MYLFSFVKYFVAILLVLNVLASKGGDTQPTGKKKFAWFDLHDKFYQKRIYAYWGYNRDRYTNSDINIHGKGFNFTIFDVAAHDKQAPFSAALYFGPTTLSIPQYNYRVGFFIKYNIHVSFGLDHMKYVMTRNQTVRMTGYIDSSISQQYGGTYVNRMMVMSPDFLQLQHTNGLNSTTLDVAWLMPIFHTKSDIVHIGWNFGTGGVFMVTRTQVHFMNEYYPNYFHLSGVTGTLYTGPRIDLWKCFFFAAEVKGGYVYIPWAPFEGNDGSGVKHHFLFGEYYIVGGLSFPINKNEYPFIKREKKKALPVSG